MKPIRILIADDEPLALEGTAGLVAVDPELEIVGRCADGEAALEQIRLRRPDVAILDVQMPRLDGLEVLARLEPERRPVTVFVTAYDRYAIQAFELCALDYLLKPFRDGRFRAALERAKERVRTGDFSDIQRRVVDLLAILERKEPAARAAAAPAIGVPLRLSFKSGRDRLLVAPSGIVWIEAQGDRTRVAYGGRPQLIQESIREVERRLDPGVFFRVHRSFIVNVGQISRITPALYGDHTLVMSDGTRIRLSRSYRGRLKDMLPAACE